MSHHPDGTIINTWMYVHLVLFFSELSTLQIVVLRDKTKQTKIPVSYIPAEIGNNKELEFETCTLWQNHEQVGRTKWELSFIEERRELGRTVKKSIGGNGVGSVLVTHWLVCDSH